MTVDTQQLRVNKAIVIDAPVTQVFEVFTSSFDLWWPRSHHVGACESYTAMIEPKVGGRWYERGENGSECDWGRVLVWEPPSRIVLRWSLDANWHYSPQLDTEVEVRFVSESPDRTRVLLEHRKLEQYGEKASSMQDVFDSSKGWSGILTLFAKEVGR